jgi:hypothetical protein
LCVDDETMQQLVQHEGLEPLRPDLRTKPRVHYRNLHRYSKCFVGGSVLAERDGRLDCVAGAKVSLHLGDRLVAETSSDAFGDFRFDRLEPNAGTFRVEVSHAQAGAARRETALGSESIYLGEIRLSANSHSL